MTLIAITSPDFLDGEAERIHALLKSGIDRVHIRKVRASENEVRKLLSAINPVCYSKLSIHDHLALQPEFSLGGVHLNSRCPSLPDYIDRSQCLVSRSCHSLEEVSVCLSGPEACDYCFLSPIFDSISKAGYRSAFDRTTLLEARDRGIICDRVIALGGVSYDNLPLVREYGFGGGAMLGEIWK